MAAGWERLSSSPGMQIGSSFALLVSGFRCEQSQQWKWLASERHRQSAGLRLLLVVVRWNIEHAAWRESRGEKSAVTLALRALLSLVLIVVSFKEKSRCSSSAAAPS